MLFNYNIDTEQSNPVFVRIEKGEGWVTDEMFGCQYEFVVENNYKYPISLRGIKVPVFEQLLAVFPNDLDVGCTDMVAVNERKLLMMVRDRGHALTIEITLNLQTARIEYFIPKICNVDMVNNLPGINKVNQDSVGATGILEIPISDLSNTLFSFISKVPMDSDMIINNRNTR